MAGVIGQGVTLQGYYFDDWQFTFNLAAGITTADIGKAVSIDTSADNKVKLAGDGDPIFGRLISVEDRSQEGLLVGAVALKFASTLPIKDGEVVARGDSVQGAGSGEVKKLSVSQDQDTVGGSAAADILAAAHNQRNVVVAVSGGKATVILY